MSLTSIATTAPVVSRHDWRPYPRASDREAWNAVPADVRALWSARGTAAAGVTWPELTASLWLEFDRTGDRGRFEGPHHARRMHLRDMVMGECVTGDGRLLDAIGDAVWSICEETSWSWPACLYMQRPGSGLPDVAEPVIDLGAGETAGLLAWTLYLLAEQLAGISPLIPRRIEYEVGRRIVDPYLERDDFWWQRAVNNWNPWCHANVLAATLCVEVDDERRAAVVSKAAGFLQRFLDDYPPDGGCDEGATYWTRAGGCLHECLELLLRGSGGAIDGYAEPVVAEIARFPLRVHVAGPWYVNFADGGPRPPMPGPVVWRMAQRVGDEQLAAFGAALTHAARTAEPHVLEPLGRVLPGLFAMDGLPHEPPAMPALRDVWLPDIEVMTARSDTSGFFLAVKGGHNDEVHNHNDVGSFVVFLDGEPVIVDAGVGSYTRQTFGEGRYDIWTMQSGWHNVPVVGGHEQPPGRGFGAGDVSHRSDDREAVFTAEIGGAYPAVAGIVSWHRTIRLDRDEPAVEIVDDFELQAPSTVELTLLVAGAVEWTSTGELRITAPGGDPRQVVVTTDPPLVATLAPAPMHDPAIATAWPDGLTRIRLGLGQPARIGSLRTRLEMVR